MQFNIHDTFRGIKVYEAAKTHLAPVKTSLFINLQDIPNYKGKAKRKRFHYTIADPNSLRQAQLATVDFINKHLGF